MQNLNQIYDKQNNSFDLLRFIFASTVIFSHSYFLFLGAYPKHPGDILWRLTNTQLTSATLAVNSFFVISGFLITQSFLNSKNLFEYLSKRFLRIMPALIMTILLIITIGFFLTNMGLKNYFGSKEIFDYFFKNITFEITGFKNSIFNLFSANPYPSSVNNSLWTLKFEMFAYFLIPLFFLRRKIFILISTLFLYVAFILFNNFEITLFHSDFYIFADYKSLIRLLPYFFAGSTIYLFKEKIKINKYIIFLCFLLLIISEYFNLLKTCLPFILPFLVIGIGCLWKVKPFEKYGDFSYGIYIYAFPIQQTITLLFKNNLNFFTYFLTCYTITLIISIFSWKYVEKPCLELKHKIGNLYFYKPTVLKQSNQP